MEEKDPKLIIEEFNNNNSIKDVIETVAGIRINKNSFPCPLHGGDNKNGSSIDKAKNRFSCWTHDCGRGLTPWAFIKRYYGFTTFQQTAEKVNQLFKANIPIFEKGISKKKQEYKFTKPKIKFDSIAENIGKHISVESIQIIESRIKECNHIVLEAPTGIGKSYTMTSLAEKLCEELDLDYVFFMVPTRSIVENISSTYSKYKKFYGDDCYLDGKFIVMTYNKSTLTNKLIENELEFRAIQRMAKDFKYLVIADEIHELLSKRNILGVMLSKEIENFICNADYSICMSANTQDFINAYRGKNIYNHTLKIEPKEVNYNADNLYIYRCSTKKDIRLNQFCNKIIENLGTHENILFSIDSKKELEELSSVLTDNNIPNVVINADNKDLEEIRQEYLSIVNDSKLSKTVVLCTSIINAGVNIINENVLTIIYQNKRSFDTNKIEQLGGRIRTYKNNDIIVFLNSPPKEFEQPKKVIGNINWQYTNGLEIANTKANKLNTLWFNYYYDDDINFKNHFNMIIENEEYKEFKGLYYIENNIVKIDTIGLYEKSRLQWLQLNYYNDEFIMEMLKDIKAQNINNVVYLIDDRKINVDILPEEDILKIDLDQYLKEIKEDDKSFLELYSYLNKSIKSKDFKEDLLIKMYKDHKNNDRYRDFINTLKKIFTGLNDKTHDLQHLKYDILIKVIDIFIAKDHKNKLLSKKKRDILIINIKRVEIYNKMYPLNTEKDRIYSLGDIEYYNIRCLDKICSSRNKVSRKQFNSILEGIFKDKGYIYILDSETFEEGKLKNNRILEEQRSINILKNNVSGSWYDKKGKKIDFQRQLEDLKENIKIIYNCTNELKLYSLK